MIVAKPTQRNNQVGHQTEHSRKCRNFSMSEKDILFLEVSQATLAVSASPTSGFHEMGGWARLILCSCIDLLNVHYYSLSSHSDFSCDMHKRRSHTQQGHHETRLLQTFTGVEEVEEDASCRKQASGRKTFCSKQCVVTKSNFFVTLRLA